MLSGKEKKDLSTVKAIILGQRGKGKRNRKGANAAHYTSPLPLPPHPGKREGICFKKKEDSDSSVF